MFQFAARFGAAALPGLAAVQHYNLPQQRGFRPPLHDAWFSHQARTRRIPFSTYFFNIQFAACGGPDDIPGCKKARLAINDSKPEMSPRDDNDFRIGAGGSSSSGGTGHVRVADGNASFDLELEVAMGALIEELNPITKWEPIEFAEMISAGSGVEIKPIPPAVDKSLRAITDTFCDKFNTELEEFPQAPPPDWVDALKIVALYLDMGIPWRSQGTLRVPWTTIIKQFSICFFPIPYSFIT